MKIKHSEWNHLLTMGSVFALFWLLGCNGAEEPEPAVPTPSSNIQITPNAGKPLPEVAGGDIGHLQDLEKGMNSISDVTAKAKFERAFRMTFSKDKSLRNYKEAGTLFEAVLKTEQNHPQTLRGMGYIAVNQGMQLGRAMAFYRAAIKADKNYGDAHYGLAFLYGPSQPAKGIGHYRQAMALGVKDTRNLKGKFYGKWLAEKPEVAEPPAEAPPQPPTEANPADAPAKPEIKEETKEDPATSPAENPGKPEKGKDAP